jgi:hypothetical protein
MNLPPPKICQLASKLFAQMGSSGKDADVARDKLRQLLEEHGLTWNDLPRILAADIDLAGIDDAENGDAGPAATQPTPDDIPDILGLVLALLEEHASTTPEQRLAIALWILHCWVFDQFVITPRLALLSPVRGCGKTTLLALIELLIPEGGRTDNTTAAAIYYTLDQRPRLFCWSTRQTASIFVATTYCARFSTRDTGVAAVSTDSSAASLALQLSFCFKVRALSDRLVSSTPE